MEQYSEIVRFIRKLYNEPKNFIPLHAPVFRGNEKKYLTECIDSTFVSSVGKFVDLLEKKIAEYTGAKNAVACVNGTNALHLALKIVGVDKNTEVITQPLTFIATANAISYCGAQPVFLDVDRDTMGLSPIALKEWLKRNTKSRDPKSKPVDKNTGREITAVIPMHTFGHPTRVDEIVAVCDEYNIPVIEDAAESLGSFYKEQHTGTFGKIGVLSFNGNKILTTGGGGMLLFNNEQLAARAKHLTTHAKVPHPWEFVHDEIGYNYRMPNINAALGVAQLEQLSQFLESKRKIAHSYKNFFENELNSRFGNQRSAQTDITFFVEPNDTSSNYWLNCILLPNSEERDAFLKFSNENGVMTRPAWRLMSRLEMFKNCQTDSLENAKWIEERLVNIPSSVLL